MAREMPSLGMFSPNYPGVSIEGGIGSYTQSLARAMIGIGWKSCVLTPGQPGSRLDEGVRIHSTSTRYFPLADRALPGVGACWRVAESMRRLVNSYGIDIVEFPNWEGFGVLFQCISSVPVVVRLHTSSKETQTIDEVRPDRKTQWDVTRERWQACRASALTTHSLAHRRTMATELGISEQRIHLITHGISVFPDFHRRAFTSDRPTVVYLGRLEKRKGTVGLLDAIPSVLARVPHARFVMIGVDRNHCPGGRSHAQYLADEFPAEVQRHVTLTGRLPQEEVDQWLQSADVFVAPSLYESFGLIFPEAMRWGTPVIGTRVGGIPEIVTDGETGLLVEPSQPQQLAAAMIRLLTDRDLRQRLGAAGRKHVEANFTVERMAKQTADLYASVIDEKGRKRGDFAR